MPLRILNAILLFSSAFQDPLHGVEARSGLPNILLILADDLGYGDPRCYNPDSKIPTPAIDRLAREGRRFTDAHAPAAVCVPTRYSLLTGRYPFRMEKSQGPLIEPGRLTLGGLLKKRGYATAGVGKWHLGFEGEKQPSLEKPLRGGPVDCGFDRYFGIPASLDIPPYYYFQDDRCLAEPSVEVGAGASPEWSPIQGAFWRAGRMSPGFKHEDVLPRFTERAIADLRDLAVHSSGKPFFLYLALAAPHTPWLPSAKFRGRSGASLYGDFTREVDDSIGRLLAELDRLRIADGTLVIFTSDNGPTWYPQDAERYGHRSAGPLRGMKGDAWEGGHRVPFIARWPGRIPPGSASAELLLLTDMLATFAAIAGEPLPDAAVEDSVNLLPAFLGQETDLPIREAAVFQSSRGVLSIRQGPWKLIPQLGSGGFTQPARVDPEPGGAAGQLYNLESDPSESRNLYLEHPQIAGRLGELLESCRKSGRGRQEIPRSGD